jgi:hypothetical protein
MKQQRQIHHRQHLLSQKIDPANFNAADALAVFQKKAADKKAAEAAAAGAAGK